jgi:sec-independent protein translocase protein TatA
MYLVIMSTILFIGGIGGPELLIVLFIAVFLFGANKLPKLARSSGQAIGEFQKGREEIEEDIRRSAREAKEGVSAEADGDEADGDEADIDALDTDDALDGDGKSPEANPA